MPVPMPEDCLLVYMTAPDRDCAEKLGAALVAERLAACANIVDNVTSLYWWQETIEKGNECACVLKTTRNRYPELEARARELHPYDVPCIVALPIVAGNAEFMDWIRTETTPVMTA